MNVSGDQANAMGGCQSCQPAETTSDAAASSASSSGASVTTVDGEKNDWIGIELKDDKGHPIPNERYTLTLPDGSVINGALDDQGKARVEGIDAGQCTVSFPDRDAREWKSA